MSSSDRRRDGRRRVVVTGLGVISPVGLDTATTWTALTEGKSGISRITQFDTSDLPVKIAAEVKGFNPFSYMDRREVQRTATFTHFALAAAQEAIQNSDLDLLHEERTRIGVEIGSALGGAAIVEEQRSLFDSKGARHISPTLIPATLINTASCAVALQYGLRGPLSAPVAACATGTVAVGEATKRIMTGEADVMLAGGADSVITPLALSGFYRLGALSRRYDPPEMACAPFDVDRDGTVVAEGAAVLVLESLEHSIARAATILAEIVGYGLTADAYHLVAPDPTGDGAARAMQIALATACVDAFSHIWICAHGTGTTLNDLAETRAIKSTFGERAYKIPVSSVKGAVGHMLGAAGAISAFTAVMALREGRIPPTLNYTNKDPECDLDYVPGQARDANIDVALVNAFGFGGQNACLTLRKWHN